MDSFHGQLGPCCLFMRINAPALGPRHVYSTWPSRTSRTTAGTSNGRHEKRPGLRCSSGRGHIAHWPVAQTDGRRRAALLPWLVATGNWQNWAHVVHVPTIARAVWSPQIPLSEKFLSAPIDPLLPPRPPLAVLVPGREARPPAPYVDTNKTVAWATPCLYPIRRTCRTRCPSPLVNKGPRFPP